MYRKISLGQYLSLCSSIRFMKQWPRYKNKNIESYGRKKIAKTLKDIVIGKHFLNRTAVAQYSLRTSKWDYVKLKIFCAAKEESNRMKRLPIEWGKLFPAVPWTKDYCLVSICISLYLSIYLPTYLSPKIKGLIKRRSTNYQ